MKKPLGKIDRLTYIKPPHFIAQRTNDDVVLLNNGQNPTFQMNQVAQK